MVTTLCVVLATDSGSIANNPFATFGALGILAGVGLWFIKRESDRATRLEEKNDKLNEFFRDTVIPTMNLHANAIEQALTVLREVRRERNGE